MRLGEKNIIFNHIKNRIDPTENMNAERFDNQYQSQTFAVLQDDCCDYKLYRPPSGHRNPTLKEDQ